MGQSKRQFGTRLKEHQKAVSTLDKGKSALAEHVCYTKHEIAWENSKVITTNNRYGQRLWLEAWHINMSNHALNRDDGRIFLTQERPLKEFSHFLYCTTAMYFLCLE